MSRSLLLAVCLGPFLASAQTAAADSADLSRGTALLPSAAAWADEATALVYNPAGLAHAGALSAVYVHERSNARSLDNDGLWVSAVLFDVVGLAGSVESLRPNGGTPRHKTALGVAVGSDTLSLGASASSYRGGPVQGFVSFDLGLQSRPARWLSLGALLRNVNAPSTASATFPRELDLSAGFRPFGERISIGVDWIASEALPLEQSRLQYTVGAEALKGLRLLAGLSHGFAAGTPMVVHAGLGVDLEHVGYTQGVAFTGGSANFQFVGRLSADKHRSIVAEKKIATVSLAEVGEPSASTVGTLLGVAAEDRYLRLLRFFDRAAKDPELAGVVLKIEGASVGLARADELRAAVTKLRAAGKQVHAYVLTAGDAEYLIASACDRVVAAPEGMVIVDGLRSSVQYLGGAAEKLGVDVDVARVGAWKSFPDQFTRKDMSAEQRETINAYLDTNAKALERRVALQRGLTPEAWRAAVDEGLKSVQRVKELKLIDAVEAPAAFEEALRAALPGAKVAKGYRPRDERDGRWTPPRTIAVVPVLGGITGGKSQSSPVGGQTAGAETFIEAINSAAEDPDVVAIVVRVDSGGGDALASDLMYRAVLEAKKKKPVVASMGDVAASGGYYVAMGADEIFASPTTLTGSIGIFFAKPGVKKLANSVGITQESIARGKLSGITDLFDPWTEEQRAVAQKWVEASYDVFITEVAASRKLTKEAVDAVARGRVWSGEDAKAKGLVNKLGGLMDAIASAKVQAGAEDEELDVVVYQRGGGLLSGLLSVSAPSVLEATLPSQLPAGVEALARQVEPHAWLLEPPKVQARMEYTVDVR